MNPPYIKRASMLISLMMLFSVALNAEQIPDPAASQKQAIDHMHHKLHDDQASFKTKEAQALKELNEMTIRDGVRIEDVNAKIDELMAAKTQIMRLRYDHLIEMRTILTDDQKAGYDKNVLNRSAVE
ncbi:MAG: Spy/CpxP family protein refolding chaperone [Proteobacteria bacterium]|nr:Spy/CpxP family protein refolding chaperone [Pseudomonadota bacterium]